MKTPSFHFSSLIILVFLFASVFHLQVHATLIDDFTLDPTIEVTGVDFDFGSVFLGTQPSQPTQFIIRNVGEQSLTFDVTVTNPDFMYFSDASSTLLPGESAVSYLVFKPGLVGVISGMLTITSNDPVNSVLNFNANGVGLTSPVEEIFIQDTVIELTTKIRPFKITNTSNERSEFHLEPFFGDFVQFPIDTYFLDPGESVWAELLITGFNFLGIQQAIFQLSHLSINGNALDPISITVELVTLEQPSGPFAYVSGGANVDYGPTFVECDMKGNVILEIDNPSPTLLICNLSSSDPNIKIYGPDSTFIVRRGDFFSAGYTFVPLAVGNFSGVVTLTTNDPNHSLFTWTVRGTGVEAPLQTVQDTVIQDEQSIKVVTIRNTTPEPIDFFLAPKHNDEHNSFLELSIAPDTISLPPGGVENFEVLFDATDFAPGVYYGAIEVVCHCGYGDIDVPFVVTILDSPQAIELPDSIHIEVPIGAVQPSSFVIQNTGNTNFDYSIEAGSIQSRNGTQVYNTGLEEFPLGSIQFTGGWYAAQYIYFSSDSPAKIANENPFSGSKHLRYVAGGDELFSPISPTSVSDVSIVEMMIDFEPGVIWKIAAKDYFFSGAGDALVIASDGSLSVEKNYPSNQHQPISGSLPEGYFNLRFSIKKSTQEFSIAVNGNVIYTGISQISDYRQVVFFGGYEEYGNLDIDDLRIIDGDEENSFLSVLPSSGTIAPQDSQTVNLLIDARNINDGVYKDSIIVHSSDSLVGYLSIPFVAIVKENISPEHLHVSDTVMIAGETLSITVSATDVDDSLISVTGFNVLSVNPYNYHLETASGNGYVTYDFVAPESPIDSYFTGMILARDSRGGVASKYFVIHVLAHNENDFALTNFKTNVELESFTDTLVLDIARPDIDKLTVKFKTITNYKPSPDAPEEIDLAKPVDVQFSLDGRVINMDRVSPYYINAWEIPKLSEGYHTLEAFTEYNNRDDFEAHGAIRYSTRRTIIHVINSTFISGFDIVDLNGAKLMDLVEGTVIDLDQPEFNSFNVLANPSTNSIRSVKFTLNDVTARIDNGAPYVLAGNPISGDTFWKNPKPGHYTLTAVPYMKYFGWGPKGTPLTVNFQIVKGSNSATIIARTATSIEAQQIEETSSHENILSVYPVPVADELYIELHESIKGNVVLNIINAQGQSVHARKGEAEEFRTYSVSTVRLGMSQGIYFVIINQANGKRIAKKFVKE